MYPISELTRDGGNALSALLARHFVAILIRAKMADGHPVKVAYSAFLVRHNDVWGVVTAGHAIAALQADVARYGITDLRWELSDLFAAGERRWALPVDLRLDEWRVWYGEEHEKGVDLALSWLANFHTLALCENEAVPIQVDEERLKSKDSWHALALAGVPKEKTVWPKTGGPELGLRVLPANLVSPDDVVPGLRGEHERIYGVARFNAVAAADLKSIEGMSGSAVFGIWISSDCTQFDYAPVGVLSGWEARSKQFAAWPLSKLPLDFFSRGN